MWNNIGPAIVLLILLLTACQSLQTSTWQARGSQSPLPIPRYFVSPLRMGPELTYTRDWQAGVYQVHLPIVQVGKIYPCFMSEQAYALAVLFMADNDQKRVAPYCDERLVRAAEYRARDMAYRAYFAHEDADGHGPNYWVEQFGCALPSYYPRDGNTVESIALNQRNAFDTWQSWKNSPKHKEHVEGNHPFYAAQRAYGIGYANGWGEMRVIITTPPCE